MATITGRALTCKQRWAKEKNDEIRTLRRLWRAYQAGEDDDAESDEGRFQEHGLGFDYVAAGTFAGQRRGYWRYQISWGGPSDEFRFYADAAFTLERVEYRFMDWFDGYGRSLRGSDLELLTEIWDDFKDMGMIGAEFERAQED